MRVYKERLFPVASDHVLMVHLTKSIDKTVEVPADANYVHFSATGEFYAWFTADGQPPVAIPGEDILDGRSPAISPITRALPDDCSFVTIGTGSSEPQGVAVSLEFWS